ncbi:MAG: SulP family inorganic anion transporter [Ilumatobacteraceae bacterium]
MQGIVPVDRKTLGGEVSAGVTLAALAIPAGMGYASLAGMPVVTGLYTIALPMIAFALLGSSRHLVVGADSATAVVMAAGLAGLATAGSDEYIGLAGLLAVMAGVLLIVARLIRLGFIADFLSRTVLIGFLTGVGVQVACGQIAGMLGVSKGDGVTIGGHQFTNTIATLVSTVDHLGDISWTTVGVSAASLAVISGLGLVTDKIPAELLVVVGSIFVSWQWDLSSHGVSTVGSLAGGFPPIGIPDVSWSDIPTLSATSVSILVLILAQSAATSRAYAAKYNDHFDENVDLVGLGAANIAAGLSGTFAVNGSPTKTQMVDGAGGRSQLAQLVASGLAVIVLLFLTEPIQYMPNAVLASVVFVVGVKLIDIAGMRRVLDLRRDEFVVAALVGATVVAAGVGQGILFGIVISIVDHLRRSYRPMTGVLVRGDSTAWQTVDATPDADDAGARRVPVRRQPLLRERRPIPRTDRGVRHRLGRAPLPVHRRERDPRRRLHRRRDDPPAPEGVGRGRGDTHHRERKRIGPFDARPLWPDRGTGTRQHLRHGRRRRRCTRPVSGR